MNIKVKMGITLKNEWFGLAMHLIRSVTIA